MAYTLAKRRSTVRSLATPFWAQTTGTVTGRVVDAATPVRVKNGETLATDGPFAETREQLGGYYLIDVPDLDEAIKWAARMPNADRGSIEIRPVMEFTEG